jgi:tetratricopeptide (TPR) repeat protein
MTEPEKEREAGELKKQGNEFFQSGLYKEAAGCYYKAIKLKPEFHQAWHNLGVVFKKMGDENKADRCFQKEKEIFEYYTRNHHSWTGRAGNETVMWMLVMIALLVICVILIGLLVYTLCVIPL